MKRGLKNRPTSGLVGYFRLLIMASGCHLSDAPRRRLIVIAQGYRSKLLRAPPGSLTCSA